MHQFPLWATNKAPVYWRNGKKTESALPSRGHSPRLYPRQENGPCDVSHRHRTFVWMAVASQPNYLAGSSALAFGVDKRRKGASQPPRFGATLGRSVMPAIRAQVPMDDSLDLVLAPLYLPPSSLSTISHPPRRGTVRMDGPKWTSESDRFPVVIPSGISLPRNYLPASNCTNLAHEGRIVRSVGSSYSVASCICVQFHSLHSSSYFGGQVGARKTSCRPSVARAPDPISRQATRLF